MLKHDEGSYHVKSAIIGGIFALIAACIGGAFLLVNTLIEKGFTISGPGFQVGGLPTQESATTITEEVPTGSIVYPEFSESDIDKVVGAGNWMCVDGYPTSVSIDNIPVDFVVQYPFSRVDKDEESFPVGAVVPQGSYATGWLEGELPNNKCSLFQPKVTMREIDMLLGKGNWSCLSQYPNGVRVENVPSNLIVNSPIILVDKNNVRYYKGEKVQSGNVATVWFANEISLSECP